MNRDIPISESSEPTPTCIPPGAHAIEMDSLRTELADLKDSNLRLTGDFQNFKRRVRQESEAQAIAQKEAFIRELLPVIDNLERALASGPAVDAPQLREGVEMTFQQLRLLLGRHGIEAEQSLGQKFDPRRHEAVSQGHHPAQQDRIILEVFQRGYHRGEQVLRPAKVVVNVLKHPHHAGHAS